MITAKELIEKLAKDEKYQEMMRKKDAELKKNVIYWYRSPNHFQMIADV